MKRLITILGLAIALAVPFLNRTTRAEAFYVTTAFEVREIGGTRVLPPPKIPSNLSGLAFDQTNNLYVSDHISASITKITPEGVSNLFAKLPNGSHPYALACDGRGNLYVTDEGSNLIRMYAPTGEMSTFATLPATSHSVGITFDSHGNLFVSSEIGDERNHPPRQITKITPTGAISLFATLPATSGASGLAFDHNGNLYTADAKSDQISKMTSNGTVRIFAALPKGSHPFGIAFDTLGNLYAVAIGRNCVYKISPDGLSVRFDVSLVGGMFIAFPPAPAQPTITPPPHP